MSELRSRLERGNVSDARAQVRVLQAQFPDAAEVARAARLLAPPAVRVCRDAGGQSFGREQAWLRAHAREYPGLWLAVLEDRLLAADPDFRVLLERVRAIPGGDRALIHRQPPALNEP